MAEEKGQVLRERDLRGKNELPAIINLMLNSRSDCSVYPNRPALPALWNA
jgi:hypothetical protein